jgi:SAM-dependent methyltransferase
MHASAYRLGREFLRCYVGHRQTRVLEIGSLNVNGSLRDHALPEYEYTGVDIEPGDGVDIVLQDANSLPFPAEHFDAILASSVFEHAAFFWILFIEMTRVCKLGGFIYLNAPSNGAFHQYPYDFWRFYPDAGIALTSWALANNQPICLVESGVALQEEDNWNDFVAVFQKSSVVTHPGPLIVSESASFSNIRRHDSRDMSSVSTSTQDQQIIAELRKRGRIKNILARIFGRI